MEKRIWNFPMVYPELQLRPRVLVGSRTGMQDSYKRKLGSVKQHRAVSLSIPIFKPDTYHGHGNDIIDTEWKTMRRFYG